MRTTSLFYSRGKFFFPYEYIYDWEKFNETSLPEKEDFYSYLNWKIFMVQITRTHKEFVKILK